MINPFKEVNWNPDLKARRQFARSLIIGFPCIALLFYVILRVTTGDWNHRLFLILGGVGAGVGLLFLMIPQIARPFYILWYGAACTVGIVISNVLLTVFYYLALTPIGLLLRLAGKDPLNKSGNAGKNGTYWQDVPSQQDPKRYFRQY